LKKETIAIHSGFNRDGENTMAVPIYQTTAYKFKNSQYASDLFDLKEIGNIYTRLTNPTTEIFEKRIAELEGGSGGLATSSGMSAITYSIINIAEVGDNIIASSKLYGGTVTLFTHTLKRFGIEVRFFDLDNLSEIESLIDNDTKGIFFETLSNPSIDLADIEEIAKIGNRYNIITIADNTVATPILLQPIKYGVDVVVHSASKYTTGQGLAIGGVVIERPHLVEKIRDNSRYKQFNEPDKSYHGIRYVDMDSPIFTLRMRLSLLRDIGAVLSPFNSWIFIQGLETLPLRMKQHSINALEIAKFLDSHPKVKNVNYPLLDGNKNRKLANKYLKNGASGLISFEVENYEKAKKIVDEVQLFSIVANIGDSKSIITHPASTTHQQLSEEELINAGVTKGLIRLSIGLENSQDLIDDLRGVIL
jgi:O-acetylhomoserine (thiol)-lyase